MSIYGVYGVSGYGAFSPIYAASAVSPVSPADAVTRGSDGTAQATIDGVRNSASSKKVEKGECQTCKNRKYVDGSNEGDVSFKAPAHIDPNHAAATVMGHEQEHVANAIAEGNKEGKELLNVSVTLHTSVCPECGRVYVSGGTTHSTIRSNRSSSGNTNPYAKQQANLDYLMSAGANFDFCA